MTDKDIRSRVIDQLLNVAPDIDPKELRGNQAIRDQFDFDSMDHLNFMIALHEEFSVEIPETSYPDLESIDGCVNYISRH